MEKVTFKSFSKLINEYKPPFYQIALAILCSIIQTLLALFIPLQAVKLINSLVKEDFNMKILFFLLSLFLLQMLFSALSTYTMVLIGERITLNLRKELWFKVLHYPVEFHDSNNSGELMSKITNDTNVIKNFLVDHLIPSIIGIITIFGSVIILFILNWKLALIFIIVFPIAFLIITPLGRQIYVVAKNSQKEIALFQGDLSRVLGHIRLVKTSCAENDELHRGNKRISDLYLYGLKTGKILSFISPIMNTTILFILVLILGFGIYQVATQQLTAGELIAVIFYIFQIMTPLTLMAQLFTQYQKAMGVSEEINQLLMVQTENNMGSDLVSEDISINKLEFIDVNFSYNEDNKILENINFIANENQKTAIIGESGGGKSTILSLIERLYLIDKGDIFYQNKSINEFELHHWRSNISYVSQDIPVMDGTIYSNLIYGLEEVNPKTLEVILYKSGLKDFVDSLKNGLLTEVGERGVKLSGGQKQRLSIARALLRQSRIVLMDEATSQLDSETERIIQHTLDNYMNGKILIVVAHRLSTIINADNIIYLRNGKIHGQGKHYDLYDNNLEYRKLIDQQQIKDGRDKID